MFVCDAYNDEMKDSEFSKRVCAYIKEEYSECVYEEFKNNCIRQNKKKIKFIQYLGGIKCI